MFSRFFFRGHAFCTLTKCRLLGSFELYFVPLWYLRLPLCTWALLWFVANSRGIWMVTSPLELSSLGPNLLAFFKIAHLQGLYARWIWMDWRDWIEMIENPPFFFSWKTLNIITKSGPAFKTHSRPEFSLLLLRPGSGLSHSAFHVKSPIIIIQEPLYRTVQQVSSSTISVAL